MPPVGQNLSCGQGAATDFSQAIPPDGSAGKNLRTRKPSAESASASDTLAQPASAAATSASPSTVPAPTPHSGTCAAIARMASSAARVRSVTSMTFSPPAASERASGTACSTRSMVSTGTTGVPERSGMGSGGDMTIQALAALLGYLSGASRTSERERRSGTKETLVSWASERSERRSGTQGMLSLRRAHLDLAPAGCEHLRGFLARDEAQARPKINDVAQLLRKPLGVPLAVAQEFFQPIRHLAGLSGQAQPEICQHFLIRAQRRSAERRGPGGIFVDGHPVCSSVSRTSEREPRVTIRDPGVTSRSGNIKPLRIFAASRDGCWVPDLRSLRSLVRDTRPSLQRLQQPLHQAGARLDRGDERVLPAGVRPVAVDAEPGGGRHAERGGEIAVA